MITPIKSNISFAKMIRSDFAPDNNYKKTSKSENDTFETSNKKEKSSFFKNKNARKITSTLTAITLAIGGAFGLKQCGKETPTTPITIQDADLKPIITGALYLHDDMETKEFKPVSNLVNFDDSYISENYKNNFTLENIINHEYFKDEKGHEVSYTKIVNEIIQANPEISENIFETVKTGKYNTLKDVPSDIILNTNISKSLKQKGYSLQDIKSSHIILPDIFMEDFKDEIHEENMPENTRTALYNTKNSYVKINENIEQSTDKEAKNLKEAILLNYEVEEDSYDYYYILNQIANAKENKKIIEEYYEKSQDDFKDKIGNINDKTRAMEMSAIKDCKIFLPDNLKFSIYAQDNYDTNAKITEDDYNASNISYSNLVPVKKTIDIKKENIKTVEGLTKFYLDPDFNSLEDCEKYDYHREKYRQLIMETIINLNPEIFDPDLDYEEQIQIKLINEKGEAIVDKINLPEVLYNINTKPEEKPVVQKKTVHKTPVKKTYVPKKVPEKPVVEIPFITTFEEEPKEPKEKEPVYEPTLPIIVPIIPTPIPVKPTPIPTPTPTPTPIPTPTPTPTPVKPTPTPTPTPHHGGGGGGDTKTCDPLPVVEPDDGNHPKGGGKIEIDENPKISHDITGDKETKTETTPVDSIKNDEDDEKPGDKTTYKETRRSHSSSSSSSKEISEDSNTGEDSTPIGHSEEKTSSDTSCDDLPPVESDE